MRLPKMQAKSVVKLMDLRVKKKHWRERRAGKAVVYTLLVWPNSVRLGYTDRGVPHLLSREKTQILLLWDRSSIWE
jgi:hypothetical protein